MLSVVLAASVLMPMHVYSTGVTAETALSVAVEESTAALVEQRLKSLREHAQATPEQQPLLAAAAEDLALVLGSFRKTPTLL